MVVEGSWERATQVLGAGNSFNASGGGRGQLGARNAPTSPEGLGRSRYAEPT